MKIGTRDTDRSVFVIAEIGINHNGMSDLAYELQEAAARAGVDAVKYQVGDPRRYVNRDKWDTPRQLQDGSIVPYIEYRESMELADDDLRDLQAHAHALGLEWFASPLDATAVPRLAALHVPCYKIASPMVTDGELLAAVREQGKPTLCSSGMTTPVQLDAAVVALGWHNVAVMHCTSEYPCPPEHNNLRVIESLQKRYPGLPVGYSGHEIGIPESIAAVALGARIVERHLTLSRAMWGSDHAASLEPEGMRRMVGYIRTVERALGDGVKRVFEGESINGGKFRRTPGVDVSGNSILP